MDTTPPTTRRSRWRRGRLLPALLAAVLAGTGLAAVGSTAQAAPTELLTNGGFESGLSGWSCGASSGAVVGSPVHAGSGALRGTPAGSDNARCSQTVTVLPDEEYTLSGWVRGSYVYLGATGLGTGSGEASTWTPGSGSWQQLTTSFRTGPATTSVTVYIHGWYGTDPYYADGLSLLGEGGDQGPSDPDDPPAAPGGLAVGTVTATSVALSWQPAAGATEYRLYRDGTRIQTLGGTAATVSGLSPATQYSFQVAAANDAGASQLSQPVTATTAPGGGGDPGGGDLPENALVGYLHASFANGSGYTRMADVPDSWDVIQLAFGEPTTVTSGDIRFSLCPQAECPNVESEAEFKAGIAAKQAEGKKVLISIGGQNGQVRLETAAARDAFVSSVSAIIDEYGLDGLDIDFEGNSLSLNDGDTDFRNPTTPVIVNLIDALETLVDRYGDDFILTMAPETFFVQLGYQYYGSGPWGGQDPRCGAYLPVLHAMRDSLSLLHVQHYNSGPIMGLDDQYHTMGNADFHVAMADMMLTGFPVAGNQDRFFEALRPDQVAIGLPASTQAGNGHTAPAEVNRALDCLTKGTNCGGYQPHGTWPGMRGLMTWSINWDRFNNWQFMENFDGYYGR